MSNHLSRGVLLGGMIIGLAGPASAANSAATVNAMVETNARELIREKLRDPKSAVFSQIRVSRRSGSPIACGLVNARNGFGGMTGNQRFVSNGATITVLESEMASGEMTLTWNKIC